MLTAHANTTADDFIAQLRTYVIAMGLSTAVVDRVDNLIGTEDAEEASEDELNKVEADARKDMKNEILAAVRGWATTSLGEETMEELLSVIEEMVA